MDCVQKQSSLEVSASKLGRLGTPPVQIMNATARECQVLARLVYACACRGKRYTFTCSSVYVWRSVPQRGMCRAPERHVGNKTGTFRVLRRSLRMTLVKAG